MQFNHSEDVRAAQVRLLYEQLPSALIATIVNAAILTAVFWIEISEIVLVGWFGAIVLVTAVRHAQRRAYLQNAPAAAESLRWSRRYRYGVAASGALWGVAGFRFFMPHSFIHQVFLAFVLIGMASGGMSTLSSSRGSYLLFVTVAVIPYGLRLVAAGTALHLAMAGMLVIYLLMMSIISGRLYAAVTESLRLRYDNLDLLSDLTQARQDLERRVQERTVELAKSEAALRDADSRKNEFLAMLGHELRNPLAPIRSALHIMHSPGVQDSMMKWAGEVIDRQTNRLTRLVDDLLDVSRIAHGKISLQETVLDIATAVHHAMEASLPLIEARHQKLSVRIPEVPLLVRGDLVRLDQVISNLLNNAAKYSDAGKDIELAVEGSEHWVTVRVQDHGIGIPGEVLPYVFDLFTQADHSLARTQGGLGIGLTLVKRLVEMHGGRVEAHSDGAGRGSRFLVHLPRLPSPAETQRHSQSTAPDDPSRILIVDDNVDAVDCLAHLLRLEGHTVATAHDGVSGLVEAGKFQPQVVLLDIGMPGMDGFQVAKELRARKSAKPMVIIALTGYGQPEDRARAEAAGFDELLTKPINLDGLYSALKTRWSRRNGS